MATPFKPRTTKQRIADTRLTIRRGPSMGMDSESRDPFSVGGPPKRPKMTIPKFSMKSPSFKAKRGAGRPNPFGGR